MTESITPLPVSPSVVITPPEKMDSAGIAVADSTGDLIAAPPGALQEPTPAASPSAQWGPPVAAAAAALAVAKSLPPTPTTVDVPVLESPPLPPTPDSENDAIEEPTTAVESSTAANTEPKASPKPKTPKRSLPLDHRCYPHILDLVVKHAPRASLIALRAASRVLRDRVDPLFMDEVTVSFNYDRQIGLYRHTTESVWGPIPAFCDWAKAPCRCLVERELAWSTLLKERRLVCPQCDTRSFALLEHVRTLHFVTPAYTPHVARMALHLHSLVRFQSYEMNKRKPNDPQAYLALVATLKASSTLVVRGMDTASEMEDHVLNFFGARAHKLVFHCRCGADDGWCTKLQRWKQQFRRSETRPNRDTALVHVEDPRRGPASGGTVDLWLKDDPLVHTSAISLYRETVGAEVFKLEMMP